MIILKPDSVNSPIDIRCRDHSLFNYLVSVYIDKTTIYLTAPSLSYQNGFISGNLKLPVTEGSDSLFCKTRFFSVESDSEILTLISDAPNDYLVYSYEQYLELVVGMMNDDKIEQEIYRGTALITSQTDFERYKLNSDIVYA